MIGADFQMSTTVHCYSGGSASISGDTIIIKKLFRSKEVRLSEITHIELTEKIDLRSRDSALRRFYGFYIGDKKLFTLTIKSAESSDNPIKKQPYPEANKKRFFDALTQKGLMLLNAGGNYEPLI